LRLAWATKKEPISTKRKEGREGGREKREKYKSLVRGS
jgi:hypothetical protein